MNKKTPGNNDEDVTTCQTTVKADQYAPPIILLPEYTSAEEAIGALSKELMMSGKPLTFKEMQLMLIVRLKLSTVKVQQNILQEALLLITNKKLF